MRDATVTAVTVAGVKAIIDKNYGANGEGLYPINEKTAERAVELINTTDPQRIEKKLMLLLWNNFTGGGLAESVANEIVEDFGLTS